MDEEDIVEENNDYKKQLDLAIEMIDLIEQAMVDLDLEYKTIEKLVEAAAYKGYEDLQHPVQKKELRLGLKEFKKILKELRS